MSEPVYASKDVDDPARENPAAAHDLLHRQKRKNWMILEMAEMNHAFQRCEIGMPDEYEAIDHVMADTILDQVSTWIRSIVPE
ncbi:MAG: hypothetical protein GY769_18325 [bacterium]|nr:hypothetical protein [bacterium]